MHPQTRATRSGSAALVGSSRSSVRASRNFIPGCGSRTLVLGEGRNRLTGPAARMYIKRRCPPRFDPALAGNAIPAIGWWWQRGEETSFPSDIRREGQGRATCVPRGHHRRARQLQDPSGRSVPPDRIRRLGRGRRLSTPPRVTIAKLAQVDPRLPLGPRRASPLAVSTEESMATGTWGLGRRRSPAAPRLEYPAWTIPGYQRWPSERPRASGCWSPMRRSCRCRCEVHCWP